MSAFLFSYLQAIERRLEKLAIDPHRDRAQMLRVEQVQQAWQQWLNKLPPKRQQEEEVKAVRCRQSKGALLPGADRRQPGQSIAAADPR
ncbi:DUF3418 domain-containing protein, partial [Serratia ureilytica]|nr:DUF3418 domain-containing protein [Serratia ureilytica]